MIGRPLANPHAALIWSERSLYWITAETAALYLALNNEVHARGATVRIFEAQRFRVICEWPAAAVSK